MRFVFVDRIVELVPSRRIETLMRVSGLEDVFADHSPGYPVLPGALVVEAFAQAARLGTLARQLQGAPVEIAANE